MYQSLISALLISATAFTLSANPSEKLQLLISKANCDVSTLESLKGVYSSKNSSLLFDLAEAQCNKPENPVIRGTKEYGLSLATGSNTTDTDSTPPEFVDIDVSIDQVDVTNGSQAISVTGTFFEIESAMDGASITINPPQGIPGTFRKSFSVESSEWSEGGEDGHWDFTEFVIFDEDDPAGEWSLDIHWASDASENFGFNLYDSTQYGRDDVSFKGLTVVNTNEVDITAPEIVDFGVSTQVLDVTSEDVEVEFIITAREAGSGINYGYVILEAPEGLSYTRDVYLYVEDWLQDDLDPEIFIGTASITFDETTPPGEWSLIIWEVNDNIGNQPDIILKQELEELGYPSSIQITNDNDVDTQAPELVSFELSKSVIDTSTGSDSVTVTIEVEDTTGPSTTSIEFRYSDYSNLTTKKKYARIYESDWNATSQPNVYRSSTEISFAQGDKTGAWIYEIVYMQDILRNLSQQGITPSHMHQMGVEVRPLLVDVSMDEASDIKIDQSTNQTRSFVKENSNDKLVVNVSSRNFDESEYFQYPALNFNLSDGLILESVFSEGALIDLTNCSISSSLFRCSLNPVLNTAADIEIIYRVAERGENYISAEILPRYLGESDYSNNFFSHQIVSPRYPGTSADLSGNGTADLAMRTAETNTFYSKDMTLDEQKTVSFARTTDLPIHGDFDGDGISDTSVWRASDQTIYVKPSNSSTTLVYPVGNDPSDIPVVADYDGDGISDAATFSIHGDWYIEQSSDGKKISTRFGRQAGDIPVPADYDGDGKADIAVRRPSNSTWYISQSSDGQTREVVFGRQLDDIAVPADYDGDGLADIAVRRVSNKNWYILESSTNSIRNVRFGLETADIPVVSDYDDDGKADIAVYRQHNSTWYILESAESKISATLFGNSAREQIPLLKPIGMTYDLYDFTTSLTQGNSIGSLSEEQILFDDFRSYTSDEYGSDRKTHN